jgi:uncharacterized protein YqgV (UPF0045/DUF77 family)
VTGSGQVTNVAAVGNVRLEFTVEPFRDGAPGPHVRAAIAAATAGGLAADVGPFGTTVDGPAAEAFDAVRALLGAAFAAGATRVSVQVTALEGVVP